MTICHACDGEYGPSELLWCCGRSLCPVCYDVHECDRGDDYDDYQEEEANG